jgi:hypothetical protein
MSPLRRLRRRWVSCARGSFCTWPTRLSCLLYGFVEMVRFRVLGKPGFRGSLLYRWSFFNRRPFVKWYVSIARFDQRVIHRETNEGSRVGLTIHWWPIEVWDFADSKPRADVYHRGDVGKSWVWNL